ncbi:hypothetical protein J6I90_08105 [Pseudidiomarina sp. 1APP75-32.1]|uniref:ABC transporter substrate-binding protein n=1 Tax=Pseudidiomarina terrestris TaxID=2820060 RepID=A0AAW7QZG3_9GAMM|nr:MULTISPECIES: hypothetical protein [unclassified Pseudidiomarina]MDN7124842.1 hypothetical protein [Pseudidiomarina sp. 1APP75-32.1]MDN7129684.1 hypothetical protein [Pseudidiomarina sp. 1APR75-15]
MHYSRFAIVIFLAATCAFYSPQLTAQDDPHKMPDELIFRAADPSPTANFVVQLFTEAYARLGIKLRFEAMPRNRSLTEANKGRIAGELGRIPRLHDEYTNLVRVDFPLFDSEVVMVADRRECGLCGFNNIDSFAYIAGTQSVEEVLQDRAIDMPSIQAVDIAQLELLYDNDRVDAILLNDFEAEQLASINDYTIFVPYKRNTGYHFLHQQYAFLVPQLEAILENMLDSGRILEILQENNAQIRTTLGFDESPELGPVRLSAGLWPEYTEADGSGAYWQVMEQVFAPVASELDLHANTFSRAYRGLDDNKFDALVGALGQQTPENTIVSRNHLDFDNPLYVFTATAEDMQAVEAGTLQRPVCHIAGYEYEQMLSPDLTYYSADSHLDCFAMLDMGRMGAVVGYLENVPDWTNSPYSMVKLRDALPVHVAFQKTPRGFRLRDWFDAQFRELVTSGAIRGIYTDEMIRRGYLHLNLPPEPNPVRAAR